MTLPKKLPKPKTHSVTADPELQKLYYQTQLELFKLKYQARLERAKADEADLCQKENDSKKAFRENEYALAQAVQQAYLDAAKGELDRTAQRAEFVQKAAAAISTAYVAVVGLTYGLGQGLTALPFQGVLPTLFLGLAIVLATAYAAYITRPKPVRGVMNGRTHYELQQERLNVFIRWARSPSLRRVYLLQASVISLGIGILFLPAAYLPHYNLLAGLVILFGALVVFTLPVLIAALQILYNNFMKDQEKAKQTRQRSAGAWLYDLIQQFDNDD